MHPSFYSLLNSRRGSSSGGSGSIVYLTDTGYSTTVVNPSIAACTLGFLSTRDMSGGFDDLLIDLYWLSAGTTSGYEIRVTPLSGTFSTGSDSTATWLNLGTSRSWKVSKNSAGGKTCTATYEIRDASSLVVLNSATISLTATVALSGGGGGGGGGITP